MKPPLLSLLLCSFLLSSTRTCPEEESCSPSTTQQEQENNKYLDQEDQKLLLIFSSIVTCFANILKEPYTTSVLALNLSGIATGVINMLFNTLECKRHSELTKQVKQLRAMTRTIKTTMQEYQLK